jgi:homocysteine S-methyltransferase
MQVDHFIITVEVVPPAGPDAETVLAALQALESLPVDGYNVATNPVAKPRMSALALSALIQERTGKPAVLHCTTRDHNRLSLQGLLWGAKALGIDSVLITTGDFVALGDRATTTTVRDVDVFDLIVMARESGFSTGVVLDPFSSPDGIEGAVQRLERKVASGAEYAITQPLYDPHNVEKIVALTASIDVPIRMGILPLRTPRHAEFLHERVSGVIIPEQVRRRMETADDPVAEGAAHAAEMLALAPQNFAGACLMPPFNHYEVLDQIMTPQT